MAKKKKKTYHGFNHIMICMMSFINIDISIPLFFTVIQAVQNV